MISDENAPRRRLPPWLKKRLPAGKTAAGVRQLLADLRLNTVCNGAHCPNVCECFSKGTATFMILGDHCTRSCRFCAVPDGHPGPPRPDEPTAVAEAVDRLDLKHVVVTSVTRDDLPDGGAEHFARTIRAIRTRRPAAIVEVLTPDFQGDTAALDAVLAAGPDVFNHNVETVPRLYPQVRPQADYLQSLDVLRHMSEAARSAGREMYTKSGLMVGLGETNEEIEQVLADLRAADCDILTIGQYLAPSMAHAPVVRFVEPDEFAAWETRAKEMGFLAAAAGPFVRSSYNAEAVFRGRSQRAPRE